MKKIGLLFLIITSVIISQNLTQSQINQTKIHPFFQEEIRNIKLGITTRVSGINSVGNNKLGKNIYQAMIRISDESEILNSGLNINSVIPGFATARVTLDEMEILAKKESVLFIYPGETFYTTNDIGGTLIGADLVKNGYINSTVYDGTGVIVLIVDTGIDWSHADFQNSGSPNTSRILYIWDQTITATGAEVTPQGRDGVNFSGLNYGVEYTQANINDEIDGSPTSFVRQNDTNGHGTHVSGSAAGNGSSLTTNKYEGIAPKADIVFVKAGNGSFPTQNLIDALEYAQKISATEGKPVVVNMSLGGHANAHDGTRDLDVAVDNFTASGNGRVAVIAAGNEGSDAIHITGTTATGASSNIIINVPSYTANSGANNDYVYLDLWWNNADNVTASVTSPNGHSHSQTANSKGTGNTADGSIYIFNYVDASHTNGDRRNYFRINDAVSTSPPAQGNWTFTVTNNSASTMTYHAWLFAKSMPATLTGGNTDYTVGSPGVATSAITVGAYVSRWMWSNNSGSGYLYGSPNRTDNIASFSSIGPRRDGVQKPDIAAPGQGIFSSTSSAYTPSASRVAPGGKHYMTQGTSMSSPICAGAVALLLDYNASLTAAQIKGYITGNADTDSFTGAVPNYIWGSGKLNIFRAMVSATNALSVTNQLIETQDWTTGYSNYAFGSDWLSQKFTPTISGKVTDVLFHPGTGITLAGNIPIEIWSDNGGNPNALIGSAVSFNQNALLPFSWNKLYFSSGGVNVTAGTPYHIVIKTPTGSSFGIVADNANTATGSFRSNNSGASWSSVADNFGIRAIVSPIESAVPVELIAFTGIVKENSIHLNWRTATEINNYGFSLECRLSGAEAKWKEIAFIEGHGNSNSIKNYNYVDSSTPYSTTGTIQYRLKQIDTDGSFEYSDIIEITFNKIYKYSMEQNYPNPFNPTTVLNYTIPNDSKVKIEIYNTLGQKVDELFNGNKSVGKHSVTWNATGFSSGTYFARFVATSLQNGEIFSEVKKLLLIK